ncbi:MAG: acyl-CoA dehydrogenase family protein [Pirellulaceae bacterium]
MYRLNDQQHPVVNQARELSKTIVAKHAQDVDEKARFPIESIEALAKAGFGGLLVPQEFGGMGQGIRTLAAVVDELAQSCPSTAMVYMMHNSGVNCYLADSNKFSETLRSCARGEHLSTLAFSEKGSRSQFWAPVSQVVASGDNQCNLSAEKSWVTSAGYADGIVSSFAPSMAAEPASSWLRKATRVSRSRVAGTVSVCAVTRATR